VLRHVLTNVHQWPSGGAQEEEGEEVKEARVVPNAAAYTKAVLSAERNCRYLFINIWRSTDTEQPVRTWPLALLHPSSWELAGASSSQVASTIKAREFQLVSLNI
jgi:hypothetical protein